MKICHSLIFFFLTFQDGNIGVVSAEIPVYEGTEGENITVKCTFNRFGFNTRKKMFCRKKCENGDVLVETSNKSDQKGRYSISEGSSDTVMYVTITDLEESDSGRYQCGSDRIGFDGYDEIRIQVTKGGLINPSSTHRPSTSKRAPTSALTTTSASAFTELSFSPNSTSESEPQQPMMVDSGPGILLYVGLVLVVIFIVFTAALVVLCRNKPNKPKEPQVDMEYTSVTEANIVYDEITEDKQTPVEISVVHGSAKFTTQTAAPASDIYSLATAAEAQDKTADASETLTYSEVDFSNRTSSSLFSSAPQSQTPEVVYSAVSLPLYSTVNQPQQQIH